jgi:FkbM family methyltransferase
MDLMTRAKKKIQFELKKRFGVDLSTPKIYRPPVDITINMATFGEQNKAWTFGTDGLSEKSIVYSFGVGEDISWDTDLIEHYGVQLYTFDPTPKSIHWMAEQNTPPQFHFYDYGLADFDGTIQFYPPEDPTHVSHTILYKPETASSMIEAPVKTLSTIMRELNHTHIDILKMDIEGAEYAVLKNIVNSDVSIGQILVEFHHRFPQVSIKETIRTVEMLQKHGYQLFHVSDTAEEFSFIRG